MSYDLLRFSLLFRRFVTVKADDSVPPFFIESEFRTLHLFRAPPSSYNQTTQSTHPSGGSTPKPGGKTCGFCLGAANLPKAVACGYSEGAGFTVSNRTLPLFYRALLRHTWATRRRGDGELCPRPRGCAHSAVPLGSHSPGASRVPISRGPSALRRGGGGHSSMASASCVRGAEAA